MQFTAIASSSKGNAYVVKSIGIAPLLVEAGVPISKLRESTGFGLSSLAGCLISHEHGDHSKAVNDLLKAGVDCYMSHGTAKALEIEYHHRVCILRANVAQAIQKWTILSFSLHHDSADPIGFLVAHGDERLLFIPDTGFISNRFAGVTIAAVECNFLSEQLSENIRNGSLPAVTGRRIRRNHMSLNTLIEMLKANDLSKCRAIHLLHLSDGNSYEGRMIKEVQKATGIPTYAA